MTQIFNKKEFTNLRKKLRNSQTSSEKILWQKLKGKQIHGLKFRRQYSIDKYIVDFYCPEINLAIEIDGCSHTINEIAETKDKQRQNCIEKLGIKFLRFSSTDIYDNLDEVINVIYIESYKLKT